jgi:hypothetical protein
MISLTGLFAFVSAFENGRAMVVVQLLLVIATSALFLWFALRPGEQSCSIRIIGIQIGNSEFACRASAGVIAALLVGLGYACRHAWRRMWHRRRFVAVPEDANRTKADAKAT